MLKLCKGCGIEFNARRNTISFHSHKCALAWRNANKAIVNHKPRACPLCSKNFQPEDFNQRYCCTEHSRVAKRERTTKQGQVKYWKARRALEEYKMSVGCQNPRCLWDGPLLPSQLEFHHVDPTMKAAVIGKMTTFGYQKLNAEIAKCTLVCSNCHRAITYGNTDASVFPRCPPLNNHGTLI